MAIHSLNIQKVRIARTRHSTWQNLVYTFRIAPVQMKQTIIETLWINGSNTDDY